MKSKLVHLFILHSKADYIAHRRLWSYLVEKMREDLGRWPEMKWPEHWEAVLFPWEGDYSVTRVTDYIKEVVFSGTHKD